MAVQAQYPSNVLFLNRSVQEGKSQICNNYSSLVVQQPRGVFGEESFLDPTQMLFNQGVEANSQKRGREYTSATTTTTTTKAMNPLMSMQSQLQLIHLAQLHTPSQQQQQQQQTNVISTGLQLAFENQSHQQHQSSISVLTDDFLASHHIKHQQQEVDHFLQVQGEQLRRTLEEKRRMHYHALIESTTRKLREKETEVEKASKRQAELAARASQLNAAASECQVKVSEQEVAAATLQAQLDQAMLAARAMTTTARECHGGSGRGGEAEDAESVYVDPDRVVEWTGPVCKGCLKRFASVVLLPCRHLCVCIECDVVAQCCPLCRSIRCSSVEVLLC